MWALGVETSAHTGSGVVVNSVIVSVSAVVSVATVVSVSAMVVAAGVAVVARLGALVARDVSAVVVGGRVVVVAARRAGRARPDVPDPDVPDVDVTAPDGPFCRRSSPGSVRSSRGVRPPWSSLAEGLGLGESEGAGVEVMRTTWPLAGTRTGTASEKDALAHSPMTAGQTATVTPARTIPMRFMMSPCSRGCEVISVSRSRGPAPLGDGRSTS